MTFDQVLSLFSNLVFPVAVAAYLLVSVNRQMEKNTVALRRISRYLLLVLDKLGMEEAVRDLLKEEEEK